MGNTTGLKTSKNWATKLSDGIDTFIGIISPEKLYRRKMFRMLTSFSNYKGADKGRLLGNWFPGNNSADKDLLPELPLLRERSRELNRSDAHAAGITHTVAINVVGQGIRPQSRVDKETLGITDEQADIFQRKAERIWQRWSSYADSANRLNIYEIQRLVQRQILENGEVIILPVMINDDNRPYSFALNIVEADRLFTPAGLRGNKNIREGVELGERGEPIAYYIRKTHPGDILYTNAKAIEYIRYPATNIYGMPNIMHLYWQKRPGQTRGEPFFAPVLALFKDLTDYIEAELIAEKIAACFAGFITKSDPYIAGINRSKEVAGKRIEEIYPGMFEYLAPGEDIKFANPSRPSGTFEPFVERILRAIGVGLGMPYELIAKDFSKTNYSSARAALLEAWRFFKVEQDWLGNKFNQPVWERLLLEAFLREEITAPNFLENRLEWTRARWIAPGRGWVDPVKEVQASLKAVEGNISTLADECASNGKDWEETLEQIARENKKKQSLGLPVGVGIDIQGEAPQEATENIEK